MNKIVALFVALGTLFIIENAQAQSPVKASVKAEVVNDSTYTLKASLQIQSDWHVYAANPDGLNAPEFKAGLETVSFIGDLKYSVQASKQSDVLFKQANVYKRSVDIAQAIVIKGFQPDSLKLIIVVVLVFVCLFVCKFLASDILNKQFEFLLKEIVLG